MLHMSPRAKGDARMVKNVWVQKETKILSKNLIPCDAP